MEKLWNIYVRCSTEEQAISGYSIEMQIKNCEAMINLIPEAKVYKIYNDEGFSGSDSYVKRKELLKMLADIKEHGNIHGIALYRADRLTRLSNEQEQLLHLLIKYGIKDIKCYSGEILSDSSPQGEFMRRTWANLNELEVKVLSFRIKSAMQLKAQNGDWKGGQPVYGFDWDNETKKMIPIKNRIEQIKLIYDLYLNEFKGATTIRDILNNSGNLYEKNSQRTLWNKERILCALKSPLYCGYQYHNTRYGKFDISDDKKYKNQDEWELYPTNFIDPIITKEQWDKAQEIRKMRGKKIISSIPNSNTWLLSSILYCGCCGEKYLGHPIINKRKVKTGEIREYDCSNYICSGKTLRGNNFCNAKQIVKTKIEKQIELITLNYINSIIEKLNNDDEIKKMINKENKIDNSKVIDIKKQVSNLNKKIDKYYHDYEEGDISAKIFNNAMERLEDEKESLQKQLELLEKENSKNNIAQKELIEIKSSYIEWMKEYKLLDNKDVTKKKLMLIQIIKYIEIITSKDKNKEDRVNIVFKTSESMCIESNFRLLTILHTHAVLSSMTRKILLSLEEK